MNIQWIAIGATLVSGGMAGSIITALVNRRRNKRQPVEYCTSFLASMPGDWGRNALPPIPKEALAKMEKELWIGVISLINIGNQDIPKFNFGVTLNSQDKMLLVVPSTLDRHHRVTTTPLDFDNPPSELDFILEPFNRGEPYLIHLVVQSTDEFPQAMKLSTPHPVKLIDKYRAFGEISRNPSKAESDKI